jgi:anthranilate phosphoribosyltransferase
MQCSSLSELAVEDAEQSLAIIQQVFANQAGPARDIVALNAGAAIYAADLAVDMQHGVDKALAVIASGEAKAKLQALAGFAKH